ncbi:MAG: hypothetical protein D9V47_07765 [Clostridia bacterium]|nr:MAG: hypothetical protein D9V47_07765 [Clostridia bacterium]
MIPAWILLGGIGVVFLLVALSGYTPVRAGLRLVLRLAYAMLIGALMVAGVNLVSPYLGIAVPLNWATMLMGGLLGLPGLAGVIFLAVVV